MSKLEFEVEIESMSRPGVSMMTLHIKANSSPTNRDAKIKGSITLPPHVGRELLGHSRFRLVLEPIDDEDER